MKLTIFVLMAAACFGQGKQNVVHTGVLDARGASWLPPTATFASPPASPVTGAVFIFTDASALGSCSGGGSSLATCRWSGSAWAPVTGSGAGGGGTPDTAIWNEGTQQQRRTQCTSGTVSYTALTAASASQEISILAGVSPTVRYTKVLVSETTQFTGTSGLTVSMGRPGTNVEFTGRAVPLGISSGDTNYWEAYPAPPILTATYSVVLNFSTTTGNVNAATGGSLTWEACGYDARGLVISSVDTTNTQAVISYAAPSTSACTVEVSESPTFDSTVNDLNTTLYGSSANSDGGGAANRRFVVGKRLVETALDLNNYSRALQAYTPHYYRLTCDGVVATGNFTTKNIPVNSSYQDIPQLSTSSPGETITPTISSSRNQTIVDPHTGALIRRVSLPTDTNYYSTSGSAQRARSGPFLNYSGAPRVCGTTLVGPGPGFLCFFPQGDGGPAVYYYIIPATGESRFIGWDYGAGSFNTSDNKFYTQSGNTIITREYTGDYLGKTPEHSFNGDTVTATFMSGLSTALTTFDPTYDATNFPCFLQTAVGDFIHLLCKRGEQDSNSYVGSLRISTVSVVALARFDDNPKNHWCAVHQIVPMGYDQPMFQIIPHGYVGSDEHRAGEGPYTTTLSSSITSSDTTINVAGEPACPLCAPDTTVPPARVGDYHVIGSETVKITNKVSPTQWIVQRGAHGSTAASHTSGDTVTASCDMTFVHWKFLGDPHGTDATNTSWVQDVEWSNVAGHNDATTGMMISEANDGWVTRVGDLLTQVGAPPTAFITTAASFAGKSANCYGNACRKHPSVGAPGTDWMSDYQQWDFVGTLGDKDHPSMTSVSGDLYKLINVAGSGFDPKHFAIAGAIGAVWQGGGALHSFLDVSPATLSTTSADNYKMCIANADGECFAGSVKGELYVNAPGNPSLSCYRDFDLCISNFAALAGGAVQIGLDGSKSRVISNGLAALRKANGFPTAKTLADGSYLLFAYGDITSYPPSQVMMAKLPPFTAGDSVDRSTFVRAPVSITTPTGLGIATAAVEFGYLEQGTAAQHYCTSRREACVAVSATVTDATPFQFLTTDTYSRLSCATSCTITLPVLPSHVAYYQVKFYDSGGAFVQNGASGVAIEGTVR